jgi:hypothetical protein
MGPLVNYPIALRAGIAYLFTTLPLINMRHHYIWWGLPDRSVRVRNLGVCLHVGLSLVHLIGGSSSEIVAKNSEI